MGQCYGQAEVPFICTCMAPARSHRLASCGHASPFVRVEMMDSEGRILRPGDRGEIVVRDDLVMKGCYYNAEASLEALHHYR